MFQVRIFNELVYNTDANLGNQLRGSELQGLMARRDRIVSHFDEQIAQKGEMRVLCSLPGH